MDWKKKGGRMIQHFTAVRVIIKGQKLNYSRYTLQQRAMNYRERLATQKNKRPRCSEVVLNISFEDPLNFAKFN